MVHSCLVPRSMLSLTTPSWKVWSLIMGVEPLATIWYFNVRPSETDVMSPRKDGICGYSLWLFGHLVLHGLDPETTFTVRILVGLPWAYGPPSKVAVPGVPGALTRMSTRLPGPSRKLVGAFEICGA